MGHVIVWVAVEGNIMFMYDLAEGKYMNGKKERF